MSSVSSSKSLLISPHLQRFQTQEKSLAAPPLTTKTMPDIGNVASATSRSSGPSSSSSAASRSRASSPSDVEPLAFDDELSVDLGNLSDQSNGTAHKCRRDASPGTDSATSSDSSQSTRKTPSPRAPRGVSASSSRAMSQTPSSRAITPSISEGAWRATSPWHEAAPPCGQSLRRRVAYACDAFAPLPVSRASSEVAPSLSDAASNSHRASRATTPVAAFDIAGPALRFPHVDLPLVATGGLPTAALAAPATISTRHAFWLVSGSVAATLGTVAVAWGTQSLWRAPLAALVDDAQREAGRYVVNPIATRLLEAAQWLGQWGYYEPPAPVPFDVTAEWHEIARRLQRLGLGMGDLIEGRLD